MALRADGVPMQRRKLPLLAVAAAVGLVLLLEASEITGSWPFSPGEKGSSEAIYGAPSLALGTFSEARAGSNYYYNATVESAEAGLTWGNMAFQVQNAAGKSVADGPENVTGIDSSAACMVAVYAFSTSSWAASTGPEACSNGAVGPKRLVDAGGAQLDLVASVPLSGVGDRLAVVYSGPNAGNSLFSIP